MERMNCLRCGSAMKFTMRENIQLGKTGWLMGDWGNLMAGALDVAVYTCPTCGKLEFFRGDFAEDLPCEEEDRMARIACPACGTEYELDSPKCPRCGIKNDTW